MNHVSLSRRIPSGKADYLQITHSRIDGFRQHLTNRNRPPFVDLRASSDVTEVFLLQDFEAAVAPKTVTLSWRLWRDEDEASRLGGQDRFRKRVPM